MVKRHSTKRSLIASLLVLCLCLTSFIGTTFAWFTDSVTSANNIIKAGNLDIEVYYAYPSDVVDGKIPDDAWKSMSSNPVFDNDALWEPGYTQLVYFKIKNVGSLAAKYQFRVNIVDETAGTNVYGEEYKLSDKIQTYVNACTNRNLFESYCIYTERDIALNPPGAPNPFYTSLANAADGTLSNYEGENSLKLNHELSLLPADKWDSELYATLCLWMPTTVGNEANPLTGTTPAQINLGITVVATQHTYEGDSFGNDYDNGALYTENASESVAIPTSASAPATLTTKGDDGEATVTVKVPASTLNALPDSVTGISLGHSTPKVDTAAKTVTFDSIEFYDQKGAVIDLAALNTTEKVTVTLPVALDNGTDVVIYHDDEQIATAKVVDGYITYEATHFCEVVVTDAANVYDYVVSDLAGLTEAFAAEEEVKVLLSNDIQFEKLVSVTPGTDVYLDMNGKKITVKQDTASNTLIWIQDGASLVVDGNGTIDLEGLSTMSIFAPWGSLTIENGTFIRNEVETITDKTTGLFNGSKSVNSKVVINGGYFDAGYYNKNAADIEAILAGEKVLVETADDIAKRNNPKDANPVRVALKENISVLLNHSGYGTFEIYGGTFVGANPAWGDEGCMLPTATDYLRPWSYYQGTLLAGQSFNENGIVLPEAYTIDLTVNNAGIPVYSVNYNK